MANGIVLARSGQHRSHIMNKNGPDAVLIWIQTSMRLCNSHDLLQCLHKDKRVIIFSWADASRSIWQLLHAVDLNFQIILKVCGFWICAEFHESASAGFSDRIRSILMCMVDRLDRRVAALAMAAR